MIYFLQHGFTLLRYDKRGAGESTGTYPDIGDYYDTGNASLFEEDSTAKFNELANDALAGVEFLKNQENINPDMIGLIGFSQGGWIV